MLNTRMLTSSPEARTWSTPPKPISNAQPSPPKIQQLFLFRKSFFSSISDASEQAGQSQSDGALGLYLLHMREHALGLIAEQLLCVIRAEELDAVVNGQDILLKLLYECGGCGLICIRVAIGVEPILRCGLKLCAAAGKHDELLDLALEIVADLLLAEVEAETVLCVILEQGVCPGRAACFPC